jgi:hypothetical protein
VLIAVLWLFCRRSCPVARDVADRLGDGVHIFDNLGQAFVDLAAVAAKPKARAVRAFDQQPACRRHAAAPTATRAGLVKFFKSGWTLATMAAAGLAWLAHEWDLVRDRVVGLFR